MIHEQILTPREDANPIATCPCCRDRVYVNEILWLTCEECKQQVCQSCAVEHDGRVLCKECAEGFICDRCHELAPALSEIRWHDEAGEQMAMVCSECLR